MSLVPVNRFSNDSTKNMVPQRSACLVMPAACCLAQIPLHATHENLPVIVYI